MPTYDYVCRKCEHAFELFQSMSAPVKRKCPACGQLGLERLIGTGAGVLFKGSGFYETDYRSETYKKAAEADSGKPKKEAKEKAADTSSTADSSSASGGNSSNEGKKTESAPAKPEKKEQPRKGDKKR